MAKRYKSLAEFLDQSDITQADFAARVGVAQSLISRIVNGERTPSLPLAVRIATEANIPLESLVPGGEGAA